MSESIGSLPLVSWEEEEEQQGMTGREEMRVVRLYLFLVGLVCWKREIGEKR
jgi:hypothetical protein